MLEDMKSMKEANEKLIEDEQHEYFLEKWSQNDNEQKDRFKKFLVEPVLRLYDMTSQVDSNGVDCFEYNNEDEIEANIEEDENN